MTSQELYKKSEIFIKELLIKSLPEHSELFLFGSRVEEGCSLSSDIDIGIISPGLNDKVIIQLKEIIEESFVPFKVDIVDFTKVSPDFKSKAMQRIIKWN